MTHRYSETINEVATLENAKIWEKETDKFVFCIDLIGVSARWSGSDIVVDELEEKFEELLFKEKSDNFISASAE